MSSKECPIKKTSIGGQAVIEGIMMRGPHKNSLAVRLEDGTIDISEVEAKRAKDVFKPFSWPIIRGIAGMVESFVVGYKALTISAEKAATEEDSKETKKEQSSEQPAEQSTETAAPTETVETKEKKTEGESNAFFALLMTFASVFGIALALFLFLWVPTTLFNILNNAVTSSVFSISGPAENWVGVLTPFKGLFEGVLKILIFIGYLAAVSLMKDIKRTFQYHGAEHKTIFCYEHGEELTVENVKKFQRFHPRCGTSFLIIILIISILISTIVLFLFPQLAKLTALWIAVKLLLIPLVCSFGYELIKLCGRHDNGFTRVISAPGLWVQRLTTKEPNDSMIEVAIAALKEVIPENSEDDIY